MTTVDRLSYVFVAGVILFHVYLILCYDFSV